MELALASLALVMLFLSSATPINSCGHCHHNHKSTTGKPKLHPIPPVTVPSIKPPKLPLPPVTLPKVPIIVKGKPCPCPPQPAKKHTCPIDTLKLGACVGGLVHVGLGDSVINQCCPILAGLVGLEAAACLCTSLKVKALNLNIYVPLALQLLITCGKTPPPGYTCSI